MSNVKQEKAVLDTKAQIEHEIDEFKAVLDAGTANPELLSPFPESKENGLN